MFPIFDLHCHPCLKIYLFNKNIALKHYPLPDLLPFGMHMDLPGMKHSQVKVACCKHYIPESGFGNLSKAQRVFKLLLKLSPHFMNKFEPDNEPEGAYNRAHNSIELLNEQISAAQNKFNVTVAKNLAEFDEAIKSDKTVFIHCLEGAHHLGKHLPTETDYIDRLVAFKQQGLCILTLGHFFQNAVCDSGGGIPPSFARLLGYAKPPSTSFGLTKTGRLVVEWCLENGVIIDLVHSTVETREQVYGILEKRKNRGLKSRPVIFSHSGVREVAEPNMVNEEDKLILPNAVELKKIKEYGGVVGLILMNYWVIGIEEDNLLKKEGGIKHLLSTIDYIKNVLGDFKNISLGTDLDGFTQVPDDVSHVRFIGRFRDAIIKKFGEKAAREICYENAHRVINEGWS